MQTNNQYIVRKRNDMKVTEAKPSTAASDLIDTSKSIAISQPNATLYISNIDWSVKKKILRRALLALFERHGKVGECVVLLFYFCLS